MADNDESTLVNNLMKGNESYFFNNMQKGTKERAFKDGLRKQVVEMMQSLTKEFEDVTFLHEWGYGSYRSNSDGHPLSSDLYNEQFVDDEDDMGELYLRDEELEELYDTDLSEITVKVTYLWERKCSLGCTHVTKRFRIISLPTLVDMLAYWNMYKYDNPKWVIKTYFEDFFFDVFEEKERPKAKRSRKKK